MALLQTGSLFDSDEHVVACTKLHDSDLMCDDFAAPARDHEVSSEKPKFWKGVDRSSFKLQSLSTEDQKVFSVKTGPWNHLAAVSSAEKAPVQPANQAKNKRVSGHRSKKGAA